MPDPRPMPAPPRRRPARRWGAPLLALLALAIAVGPALGAGRSSGAPSGAGLSAASPSPSPSASPSPSTAPSPSPSAAPSGSPAPSPSASASASPSASPGASPSPSPSASASPSPTASPTASPAPSPSATPWPTPSWPTTVTTLAEDVRFYGLGYGHGVGLNQHGARGRALAGQTAEEILAAYFTGTTPATTSPGRLVRVLVLAGYTAVPTAPLLLHGRGGPWRILGLDKVFPDGGALAAWRTTAVVDGVATTTWRVRVTAPDGEVLHAAVVSGTVQVRPAAGATRLQLDSKRSTYDTYRGALSLILKPSSVNVVNRIGLDHYLRGVLPVEMPASWPLQALRAQAVAARSYAVRRLRPGTGSFDVYDDTRSQVYRGVHAERAATNAVINAWPGAILLSGTSVVNAVFHSTGGGATEHNEYAFVPSSGTVTASPVPYLRGFQDRSPEGIPWDAAAPRYRWASSTLTRAQLGAMFARDSRTNVGDLLRLDLRRRGVSGRLYQVTLIGSGGTRTVSADVFRAVYNARRPAGTQPLLSNLFDSRPIP